MVVYMKEIIPTLTSFPSNTKDLLYVHNGPSFKLTITPGLNGQKNTNTEIG